MMIYNESLEKILFNLLIRNGNSIKSWISGDLEKSDDYRGNIIQFLKDIKIPKENKKVSYEFNIANYLEAKLFEKGLSIWKSLSRQNYSTINHICLLLYDLLYDNRRAVIITKNKQDYERIINIIIEIYNSLPDNCFYLKSKINKSELKDVYIQYYNPETIEEAWDLADNCIYSDKNIMIDNAEYISNIIKIYD